MANVLVIDDDRLVCDSQKVYMCDKYWKKVRVIYEGKIPVLEKGNSEIVVNSEFSSSGSPALNLEFKSIGKPEKVMKMN